MLYCELVWGAVRHDVRSTQVSIPDSHTVLTQDVFKYNHKHTYKNQAAAFSKPAETKCISHVTHMLVFYTHTHTAAVCKLTLMNWVIDDKKTTS